MSKIAEALQRAKMERGEEVPPAMPSGAGGLPGAARSSAALGVLGRPFHAMARGGSVVAPPMADDALAEAGAQPVYVHTRVTPSDARLWQRNRILPAYADPLARDAYSVLRTQILDRTRATGANAIMVTSPNPGEGKTTTAINLAVSMAMDVSQTALLVDTHLRSPKIAEYLGLPAEKGLSDYFMNDLPVSEVMVNPGVEKLVVIGGGKPIASSTEILGSPKMRRLVRDFKTRYPDRYVIFDCPHLLQMPDSLVFSSYVDGVILVVEAGKTSREDVTQALALLEGRNVLGVVLNKAA